MAVPPIGSGVSQHSLNILRLGFVVTAALTQEGTPDITVKIHWFARAWILANLKNQDRFALDIQPLLGYPDIMVNLTIGMQNGKKIVLYLVQFLNTGNREFFAVLGNAKYQPAAVGIGKRGNSLKRGLGYGCTTFLELDVVPFPCLE